MLRTFELLRCCCVLLLVCLCAGCRKQTDEKEAKPEQASTAESRSKRLPSGEIALTLDNAAQTRIGLVVAPLVATNLVQEIKAYGRALDPGPLVTSLSEFAAAQVAFMASKQEFERLQTLSQQNNASARALQSAEAAAKRDQLAIISAQTRLTLAWGKALAGRADLDALVQSLSRADAVLIRVDLLPGDTVVTPPNQARLVPLDQAMNPLFGEFLDFTANTDAQTQGHGFLYLVKSPPPALRPGAAVTAYLPKEGEPLRGVIVPRDAVVRHEGKAWIYAQADDTTFIRHEVWLDRSLESGWFVSGKYSDKDRVVVTGAGLLLSDELSGSPGE